MAGGVDLVITNQETKAEQRPVTSGSDRVIVPPWVPDWGTEGLPRGSGAEQAVSVRCHCCVCVFRALHREGASLIQQQARNPGAASELL